MTVAHIRRKLSLLTSATAYVTFYVVSALSAHYVAGRKDYHAWLIPCLGFLLLPSVLLQLVSAILLLQARGDRMSTASTAATAILHILQLGFLWRHVTLAREVDPKIRSRETCHFRRLQLLLTFTSILPLVFIYAFITIHHSDTHWKLVVACLGALLCGCFYLSLGKPTKEVAEGNKCAAHKYVLKMTWRIGEIIARTIAITVFASLHTFWIFVIIGLHAVTMAICLCTSLLGGLPATIATKTRTSHFMTSAACTCMYITAFVNLHGHNSNFRYCFFYIIMVLENFVLVAVWYFDTGFDTGIVNKNATVILFGIALAACIAALLLLKVFRGEAITGDSETECIYESGECINCRLSVCSKHNIKRQRPFSAGWVSQYQKAIDSGNYYKNILQDSYFDSDVISCTDLLNSSGEHCHIRDTDVESIAIQASGTYTHKRFFDSNSSIANLQDGDSISGGSGVYDEDWRRRSDPLMTPMSAADALSMVSSRTHLLTDSWDSLILQASISEPDNVKHPKRIDILNSLIRKDLDNSFMSDFTAGHTLDSYQLPVTVLAKSRTTKRRPRMGTKAYSTASDSTDCTICAFMRQHPSSPETSRRMSLTEGSVTEGSTHEVRRRRKRSDNVYNRSKSKRRNVYHSDHGYSGSERSNTHTHKYEKASSRKSRQQRTRATSDTSGHHSHSHSHTTRHTVHSSSNASDLSKQYERLSKARCKGCAIGMCYLHSSFEARQKHASVRAEVGSDSGDSAFPRNTPVRDLPDILFRQATELTKSYGSSKYDQKTYRTKPMTKTRIESVNVDKTNTITGETRPITHKRPRSGERRMKHVPAIPPSVSATCQSSRDAELTAYVAATSNEKDGTSESSCEMII